MQLISIVQPSVTLTEALPARTAIGDTDSGARLRIMHVIDRFDIGGTEKVMVQLIQKLDPKVFEQSICAVRGASERARAWDPKLQILDCGAEGSSFQFNVLRLYRHIRKVRPTIVHSRNWGGIEAILAARLARVPVIIHSEHGYQLEMQHGLPKRQRRLRHFCYKYATAVVAVSDELREYHEEQAECENGTIEVLYNGVDASSFKPRPEVRSQVRRELNIPEDGLVIGFVGRMVALKDVPTLLKAVEILAPETPSIHVLLVGSGPEQAHLQEQVNASPKLANRVTFAGATDKVADLLSAMDVFVLPSLLEGMSNTLLEALATGLPVLATRVGGNCEVVEDGVSGYLFNPQNAGELSIRLRSLLHDQDRRQRFGRAARERATTRFSLDGMLQRYSDFYLRLARQQGVTLPKEDYVRN